MNLKLNSAIFLKCSLVALCANVGIATNVNAAGWQVLTHSDGGLWVSDELDIINNMSFTVLTRDREALVDEDGKPIYALAQVHQHKVWFSIPYHEAKEVHVLLNGEYVPTITGVHPILDTEDEGINEDQFWNTVTRDEFKSDYYVDDNHNPLRTGGVIESHSIYVQPWLVACTSKGSPDNQEISATNSENEEIEFISSGRGFSRKTSHYIESGLGASCVGGDSAYWFATKAYSAGHYNRNGATARFFTPSMQDKIMHNVWAVPGLN